MTSSTSTQTSGGDDNPPVARAERRPAIDGGRGDARGPSPAACPAYPAATRGSADAGPPAPAARPRSTRVSRRTGGPRRATRRGRLRNGHADRRPTAAPCPASRSARRSSCDSDCTAGGMPTVIAGCSHAWIRAVSASLLPFRGWRSGTGCDRALGALAARPRRVSRMRGLGACSHAQAGAIEGH